tara:strand:- start:182 stop:565 length:384 start_codon:yes stop_codon:yes gene_type:complete
MKKIMLVDDKDISNFIMRKFIEIRLPHVTAIEYTNPTLAFDSIVDVNPDLIFLDLNMPDMDGWQFLDRMKAESLTNKVAILTSSTSELDMQRGAEYGNVVQFFVKPLTPDELSRIAEETLSDQSKAV